MPPHWLAEHVALGFGVGIPHQMAGAGDAGLAYNNTITTILRPDHTKNWMPDMAVHKCTCVRCWWTGRTSHEEYGRVLSFIATHPRAKVWEAANEPDRADQANINALTLVKSLRQFRVDVPDAIVITPNIDWSRAVVNPYLGTFFHYAPFDCFEYLGVHIYPAAGQFDAVLNHLYRYLDKCGQGYLRVFVGETGIVGGTVDQNRQHMDQIIARLDRDPRLAGVTWFASSYTTAGWENQWLLKPDSTLTDLGEHFSTRYESRPTWLMSQWVPSVRPIARLLV